METSIHTEIMTSMSSVEVMALADMPFLQAKQILEQDPLSEKLGAGFHCERSQKVTQLITLCHCVPGCLNISLSPPCVKHDGDNSKSQAFSSRKNKSYIFPPLKQTANLLILREIASVRPPQFKGRIF